MFLICKNLSLLQPKVLGALLWVWLNLALWFWTTRSLIFVNVFHYFIIVFNWTNLNPLQPRILCTKIGWNWTSGSGEYVNVKSLQTLSIWGGYCGTNLTMLDFEKKSKNFFGWFVHISNIRDINVPKRYFSTKYLHIIWQ